MTGLEFEGKRVLVTGASSGIGAGLAEAFGAAGAVVGLCARRQDRLTEVLERCRVNSAGCQMWTADLRRPDDVDRVAGAAVDALGGIDILVNNAGIPRRRHVTVLDAGAVEEVMAVNYLAAVRLSLALLPQMLARGEGRIVNISSVAATLSSPGEAAYAASKAALTVFGESMAIDLWDTGVKVLTVYPGVVDTELFSVPGNDPLVAPVEPIPVADAVAAVLDALGRGAVEVYVPDYFKDLAVAKAGNVEGFLSGTAEYVRQQSPTAESL